MKKWLLRLIGWSLFLSCIGVSLYIRFAVAPANSTENYLLVTYWPVWLAIAPIVVISYFIISTANRRTYPPK